MLVLIASLIFGLVVLMAAGELVVRSSVALARWARISELAIGFIFLSVATGFPELTVAIVATLDGFIDLAIGDAVGASITDITLALGMAVFAGGAVFVRRRELFDIVKVLFITSILPLMLTLYRFSSFVAGVVLLYVFFLYAYTVLRSGITTERVAQPRPTRSQALLSFVGVFAGIFLLVASGSLVVSNAAAFADTFGVTKTFVGAFLLASATSLPELSVGISALRAGAHSLAIGAILGSSIVNISLIMGFVSLLMPFSVELRPFLNIIIFLIIANIVTWYFLQTRGRLTRREGILLLTIYVLYFLSALGIELKI